MHAPGATPSSPVDQPMRDELLLGQPAIVQVIGRSEAKAGLGVVGPESAKG